MNKKTCNLLKRIKTTIKKKEKKRRRETTDTLSFTNWLNNCGDAFNKSPNLESENEH